MGKWNVIKCRIGDVIGPIWYRFFGYRHHIVKTSLTPAVWYDTDTRILFAVMDTVKWYVDNDMYPRWTEEMFDEEVARIKAKTPEEYQEEEIAHLKSCYDADQVAIEIAEWWENYLQGDDYAEAKGYKQYCAIEERRFKEEQEMLMKAIKYRNTMWS